MTTNTTVLILVLSVINFMLPALTEDIVIKTIGDVAIHMASEKGVDIRETTSILFKVKGCNDALLRLYETNDIATSTSGTITLGGWSNDKCVMDPCPSCGNRYSIRYPFLNCNELRPMWLNWTGRLLSVGEGEHVGEKTFMTTEELRPFDFQYLGVFSNWNVKVDWVFNGPGGDNYERVIPDGVSSRPLVSTTSGSSVFKCIDVCRATISCQAISYRKDDSTCNVYMERIRSSDIVTDPAWETWAERD